MSTDFMNRFYQDVNTGPKVANPTRGQLNRENNIPLSPCVPENLVSRDGFSRPVPRASLLISILRLNLVLTYGLQSVRCDRSAP